LKFFKINERLGVSKIALLKKSLGVSPCRLSSVRSNLTPEKFEFAISPFTLHMKNDVKDKSHWLKFTSTNVQFLKTLFVKLEPVNEHLIKVQLAKLADSAYIPFIMQSVNSLFSITHL
jgi:hypothetical protein